MNKPVDNKYKGGVPFWAWNTNMTEEIVDSQIEIFNKMGMGGFLMHTRYGMQNEYLGKEYMSLIRKAVSKAKELNMKAWLYDEDCWPSGYAGGKVTKNHEYRAKSLLMTKKICEDTYKELLAVFDIDFNDKGEMISYKMISVPSDDSKEYWYVYKVTATDNPWLNMQADADVLSIKATERFIELTHEAYKKEVGDEFGRTIPGVFTDEPHYTKRRIAKFSDENGAQIVWTNNFEKLFYERYGRDILDELPELFWEHEGGISNIRYLYHRFTSDLFNEAFLEPIHNWCRENNLVFTGHLCGENTLLAQTECNGDAMLAYSNFDIPGFDILCNRLEFTTANQVRSAANQCGKKQMISELYGVTGWNADFRDYKLQGDWQVAFGVELRAHHLSWASMKGEGKRDYPASFNYQSPWYEDFSVLENHYSRLNSLLEGCEHITKVAVISPLESFWLHYGCRENTALKASQHEENFANITRWLLTSMINFDFISESLLEKCNIGINDKLTVGNAIYDTVIVPGCETLRENTVRILGEFIKRGGDVTFMGEFPTYQDGKKCDLLKNIFGKCCLIPFYKSAVIEALSDKREVFVKSSNGEDTENFISSFRKGENCKWLFLAHINQPADSWQDRAYCKALSGKEDITVKIKGEYTPLVYDTVKGISNKIPYSVENGYTVIPYTLYAYDSLLIKLIDYDGQNIYDDYDTDKTGTPVAVDSSVEYYLSDDNVLLLDTAKYSFDGGVFEEETDILNIDKILRQRIGIYEDYWIQPWAKFHDNEPHYVELLFEFTSNISVNNCCLALENADTAEIVFNDVLIDNKVIGWYADKEIQKVFMGTIKNGINTLKIRLPFGQRMTLENCYILGNFGVNIHGKEKFITEKGKKLGFGSVVNQGLAFYGGNITYEVPVETNGEDIHVHLNNYCGAAIKVTTDGEFKGYIIYPPYDLIITDLKPRNHIVEFTLLGNRANTFGTLHNADSEMIWIGYHDWRTEGDKWCDEYVLSNLGIMSAPQIKLLK